MAKLTVTVAVAAMALGLMGGRVEAGRVHCPLRMTGPYKDFRYSYSESNCFKCNNFKAVQNMKEKLFSATACTSSADSPLCAAVHESRSWTQYCVCGVELGGQGSGQVAAALAFPGKHYGGASCSPAACFHFFSDMQERQARKQGSSLTFGPNAMVQDAATTCASCSSGILSEAACSQIRLNLDAKVLESSGQPGSGPGAEGEAWISQDLVEVATKDDEDEIFEDEVFDAEASTSSSPGPSQEGGQVEQSIGTDAQTEPVPQQNDVSLQTESLEVAAASLLANQQQLYDKLVGQLRSEIEQLKQEHATQLSAEAGKCNDRVSTIQSALETAKQQWQAERKQLQESHTREVSLLTTNLLAASGAEATVRKDLEQRMAEMRGQLQRSCEEEKVALGTTMQATCSAQVDSARAAAQQTAAKECQEKSAAIASSCEVERKSQQESWSATLQEAQAKAVAAAETTAQATKQLQEAKEAQQQEAATRAALEAAHEKEKKAWLAEQNRLSRQVLAASTGKAKAERMLAKAEAACIEEKAALTREAAAAQERLSQSCASQAQACKQQVASTTAALEAARSNWAQQLAQLQQGQATLEGACATQLAQTRQELTEQCQASLAQQRAGDEQTCAAILDQRQAAAGEACQQDLQAKLQAARSEANAELEAQATSITQQLEEQARAWLQSELGKAQQEFGAKEAAFAQNLAALQQRVAFLSQAGLQVQQRAEACEVQKKSLGQLCEERLRQAQTRNSEVVQQCQSALNEAQQRADQQRQAEREEQQAICKASTSKVEAQHQACREQLAQEGRLAEARSAEQERHAQELAQQAASWQRSAEEAVEAKRRLEEEARAYVLQLQLQLSQANGAINDCSTNLKQSQDEVVSTRQRCEVEANAFIANLQAQHEQAISKEQSRSEALEQESRQLQDSCRAAASQQQALYDAQVLDTKRANKALEDATTRLHELINQCQARVDEITGQCTDALNSQRQDWETQCRAELQRVSEQAQSSAAQNAKRLDECMALAEAKSGESAEQVRSVMQQAQQLQAKLDEQLAQNNQLWAEGTKLWQQHSAYQQSCEQEKAGLKATTASYLAEKAQLQSTGQDVLRQLEQCTAALPPTQQALAECQQAAMTAQSQAAIAAGTENFGSQECELCRGNCGTFTQRKFYKGGQYLPGHGALPQSDPRKRAPIGGCWCCLPPGFSSLVQLKPQPQLRRRPLLLRAPRSADDESHGEDPVRFQLSSPASAGRTTV